MYSPRKVTYPLFIVIFSLCFFGILFLMFFNQGLSVRDASVSVSGSNVVIKMFIDNNSGHQVNNIMVAVESSAGGSKYLINGAKDISESFLAPGQSYEFVASQPITDSVDYLVRINGSFNREILLNFPLDESTLDPVKAEVSIPSRLYLGEKFTYPVKLCNTSNSELAEVIWLEQAEEGAFKESFFERGTSLKLNECKTIYSTLTPNKLGEIQIVFILKVGSLEKKNSKLIIVVAK